MQKLDHPPYLRLLPDRPTRSSFDYPAWIELQNRRQMELREEFRRDMWRIFEKHAEPPKEIA